MADPVKTDFLIRIGAEKQKKRERLNQQKQNQEMMLNKKTH
jgi:hypothetical protein